MNVNTTTGKPNIKPLLFLQSITLGCDPEFFFADKSGKVVGSEKVLPKSGLAVDGGYNSKAIIDGVQAELNPMPSTCREQVAWQIAACFRQLQRSLSGDIKVLTNSVVDIDQAELDSLSEGSRVFGCAPSTNVYYEGKDKTSKIAVDPKKYLKRSAGGHIHLGNAFKSYTSSYYYNDNFHSEYQTAKRLEKALKEMPDVMVRMLDTVVGNTAVLIDRDPANAERRKNYGRAGEYRLKPYGIEYRTLSNFWLRSYPLFSMMFGLARFAVHLVEQSTKENDYIKAIFDAVPQEDVVKAINENDFDLAYSNFKKIEAIILAAAYEGDRPERYYPLKQSTIALFHHFVKRINEMGLEYWFKDDAFTHWTSTYRVADGRELNAYNKSGGWELWLKTVVAKDKANQEAIDLNAKQKVVAQEGVALTR